MSEETFGMLFVDVSEEKTFKYHEMYLILFIVTVSECKVLYENVFHSKMYPNNIYFFLIFLTLAHENDLKY